MEENAGRPVRPEIKIIIYTLTDKTRDIARNNLNVNVI